MGLNSRALKAEPLKKTQPKPKDIIFDPMGQYNHPGEITKIPGDRITMKNIPYPVLGIDNNGNKIMMMPGGEYHFPDADHVIEYPQMKKGGITGTPRRLTNKNIQSSINFLFLRNQDLFGPGGRNTYKAQDGGTLPKNDATHYYTNDINDYANRSKLYADSLYNYKWGENTYNLLKKLNPNRGFGISSFESDPDKEYLGKGDEKPLNIMTINYGYDIDKNGKIEKINNNNFSIFKKPIQQVIYQPKPQVKVEPKKLTIQQMLDSHDQELVNEAFRQQGYVIDKNNTGTFKNGDEWGEAVYKNPIVKQESKPITPVSEVVKQPIIQEQPKKKIEPMETQGYTQDKAGNRYYYIDNKSGVRHWTNEPMKNGGEAFPQQPTEDQFFDFGFMPQGPVGFYKPGGSVDIAFPQAPDSNQFYDEGFIANSPVGFYEYGGEPCMECGGVHLPENKSGGFHINPAHKGWCTPMTKPTCTGKRRQFAINAKHHFKKQEFGGEMKDIFRDIAMKAFGGESKKITNPDAQEDILGEYNNNFMNHIRKNTMMSIADEAAGVFQYGGIQPPQGWDDYSADSSDIERMYRQQMVQQEVQRNAQLPVVDDPYFATQNPYLGKTLNLKQAPNLDLNVQNPQAPAVTNYNMDPNQMRGNKINPSNSIKSNQVKWNKISNNFTPSTGLADTVLAGVQGITSIIRQNEERRQKDKLKKFTLADNSFMSTQGNRGDYNWTGQSNGMLRPNQYVPIQYSGQSFYQSGGEFTEGDEVDMSPEELQEFLASGGEIY